MLVRDMDEKDDSRVLGDAGQDFKVPREIISSRVED